MMLRNKRVVIILLCLVLLSMSVLAADYCDVAPTPGTSIALSATAQEQDYCAKRVLENFPQTNFALSPLSDYLCYAVYDGVSIIKSMKLSGASPYIIRLGLSNGNVAPLTFPKDACPQEKILHPAEWGDVLYGVSDGVFEPITPEAAKRCIAESGSLFDFYLPICVTCGNGKIDLGEQCDDGNKITTDFCSSECQVTASYQYGDLNLDGKITTADSQCSTLMTANPAHSCAKVSSSVADLNCDTIISSIDVSAENYLMQYKQLQSGDANANGIPDCKETGTIITPTCVDPDKTYTPFATQVGAKYDPSSLQTKTTVYGKSVATPSFSMTDSCDPNTGRVIEAFCDTSSDYGWNSYDCLTGMSCVDGACVASPSIGGGVDIDGDGVLDVSDTCPTKGGTVYQDGAGVGCPVGDTVPFDGVVNQADLTWIKTNPGLFWNEVLHQDIAKLNPFIKGMVSNWS